jgi:hypothetical protein
MVASSDFANSLSSPLTAKYAHPWYINYFPRLDTK